MLKLFWISGPLILLGEGIFENPETTLEQIRSLQPAEGSESITATLLYVQAASPLDVGGPLARLRSGQVPRQKEEELKQPAL